MRGEKIAVNALECKDAFKWFNFFFFKLLELVILKTKKADR